MLLRTFGVGEFVDSEFQADNVEFRLSSDLSGKKQDDQCVKHRAYYMNVTSVLPTSVSES